MELVIFLNYREIKRKVRIYTSVDLERFNFKYLVIHKRVCRKMENFNFQTIFLLAIAFKFINHNINLINGSKK